MRKLTAILFLIITCISYTGYYGVCKYQIYLAKEQAELKLLKQIPDSLLTKIDALTAGSVDDNELWYNNQMFDIVKQVSENGKLFYMCIADDDEAAAVKKMSTVFHSQPSAPGTEDKGTSKLKNFFPDIFCNQFIADNDLLKMNSADIDYGFEKSCPLSKQVRNIFIPPPRI